MPLDSGAGVWWGVWGGGWRGVGCDGGRGRGWAGVGWWVGVVGGAPVGRASADEAGIPGVAGALAVGAVRVRARRRAPEPERRAPEPERRVPAKDWRGPEPEWRGVRGQRPGFGQRPGPGQRPG